MSRIGRSGAIAMRTTARRRAPLLAIPFFLIGMAFSVYQYTAVGDLPEDRLAQEIEALLDRIADRPDRVFLRIRLARLYAQHDQVGEAIQALTDGLSRPRLTRRNRYDLYVELSRLYLESGDSRRAYRMASLARKLFPSRAPAYNRRGQSHEASGSNRNAVREYKRAERVEPGDPESYYRRALLHEKKGRLDRAEALLREAVTRAPASARALVNLAEFLLRQGKTEEALELLRRAIVLAPKDGEVRLVLGRALQQAGQEDLALVEYRRATRLDPRLARAAEAAGDIYVGRSDFRRAVERYEKALQFDRKNRSLIRKYRRARRMLSPSESKKAADSGPRDSKRPGAGPASDAGGAGRAGAGKTLLPGSGADLEPAREGGQKEASDGAAKLKALGRLRYGEQKYDEARALFARAAALEPKDDESHYLLGRALLQLKRTQEGTHSLERAVVLNPKNGAASFHLGLAEYSAGRYTSAAARFRAAAENSPSLRDQALFNQGRSAEKSGDNQTALALYERVATSRTLGAAAAINLAILSKQTKQMGRARRVLVKATAQFPKEAELWFHRGTVEEALGKNQSAQQSYDRALEARTDYLAAWFNSGVLAGRLGQNERAVQALEKATSLGPKDAAAQFELGRALMRVGRQADSRSALAAVLKLDPGHPGATILLAPAMVESGHQEEAVRLLEAARSRHRDNYDLAFNAGNLLRKSGHNEACRLAYRDALRLEPRKPDAYMNLALSYMDTKDHDRAARVYEALLQRIPDHAPAHEQLGILYYRELNRPKDGARHIRRFLRLRPGAPNAPALRRLLEAAGGP